MIKQAPPADVPAYIAAFPAPVQKRLKQVRSAIRKAAPEALEVISYSMPAYKSEGMLLYFAAFNHHIGFYPMTTGINKFKKEISVYKWAKGSVQFPHDQPLPLDLIDRIVRFRVKENAEKALQKKAAKKTAKKTAKK